MTMSTFKSSGYRTWSTRTFPNPVSNGYDLSYVTPERSNDVISQGSHLRLHLVTNSHGLIELDLRDRELNAIPMEVFLFPRLEVLKLSLNHFEEIPLAISRLRSLKFLYLEENSILFLPETLSNCINLVEVNLTRNKLPALPTNIGMLRNLRVLKIGQNDFECLPHEIGMLENLRYLDIHTNRLWYLPFSLSKLHKLKYLNLANNRFEHLPLPVCKITSLKTLTLRGNNLMNLLPDFDNLRNLQELNLSYNKFELIPQSVFRLKHLLYINLTGNSLQSLPTALTGLKSLKVIHAQDNQIAYIPEVFPNLLYLNVANNKLFNFSVASMKQLKSLNANNNFLENIPMGTYSLPRIQSIRLSSNQIRYVSPDIVQLRKLRTLDLGNNKLTSIPHVLQQLDRLDYFNVRGNSIKDKVHLQNGDINVHTDLYRKRHSQYGSRRQFDPHHRYYTHDGRSRSRSKSRGNSTISRSFTLPLTIDSAQKMWDSDDLLQNGFSERHLETNSSSAYLNRREPQRSNTMNSAFEAYGQVRAHKAALQSDSDEVSFTGSPVRTTDYQLLGICNQVEMLLNKQLLHPVLSLKGHDTGKRLVGIIILNSLDYHTDIRVSQGSLGESKSFCARHGPNQEKLLELFTRIFQNHRKVTLHLLD